MLHIIQKLKQSILLAVVFAVATTTPMLFAQPALAADAGSCYFEANGAVPAYVGKCSAQFPNGKDAAGHALSAAACYDISAGLIATKISCSDKLFDPGATQKAACEAQGGTWSNGKCIPAPSGSTGGGGNCANLGHCDLISKYINPLIQFLSALVGVAVVVSIVIGGIQYGSSAGDPQKASAAKNRIRNAILALVTFLFLYALLNFLVPGGLFNQ
ncbi:MAG: hypothetical protein WC498_03785 [Candidatus Saccharimonadales bacterium]